jgi:hypothetical protein
VEFTSRYDEPDTTLTIVLDDAIKLVSGELVWQGSVTANQKQTHEISVCPQFSGTWRIRAFVSSQKGPDDVYGDVESVFLEVTEDAARVISAYDYEPTFVPRNTPLPELEAPICP